SAPYVPGDFSDQDPRILALGYDQSGEELDLPSRKRGGFYPPATGGLTVPIPRTSTGSVLRGDGSVQALSEVAPEALVHLLDDYTLEVAPGKACLADRGCLRKGDLRCERPCATGAPDPSPQSLCRGSNCEPMGDCPDGQYRYPGQEACIPVASDCKPGDEP